MDRMGCSYYKNAQAMRGNPQLRPSEVYNLWDIEDLVKLGKRKHGAYHRH